MLRTYLRFVLDQFMQHKIRFMLTLSGIVVGVTSLTVLASFLSVGREVLREMSVRASGDDVVTIRNDWQMRRRYPNERQLSEEDRRHLLRSKTLQHMSFSPEYADNDRTFQLDGKDGTALLYAINAEAMEINNLSIAFGRAFTSQEYGDYSRVCLVGASVLKEFERPWIGKRLTVDGFKFLIVGILKDKPTMGPGGDWSWNNRLILPATTYNVLYNPDKTPNSIISRLVELDPASSLEQSMNSAGALITQVMMMSRTVKNFRFDGIGDREDNEKTVLFVIQVLMMMTTVFSLIIGGINVMNIMLVTVTERTKEIGIRRALGASSRDILAQFLIESICVTLTGAAIGFVLALGGLLLLSSILTRTFYPWPFFIAWWSVALSIVLTTAIGIIFGLSPAIKAAALDPVVALRYE